MSDPLKFNNPETKYGQLKDNKYTYIVYCDIYYFKLLNNNWLKQYNLIYKEYIIEIIFTLTCNFIKSSY